MIESVPAVIDHLIKNISIITHNTHSISLSSLLKDVSNNLNILKKYFNLNEKLSNKKQQYYEQIISERKQLQDQLNYLHLVIKAKDKQIQEMRAEKQNLEIRILNLQQLNKLNISYISSFEGNSKATDLQKCKNIEKLSTAPKQLSELSISSIDSNSNAMEIYESSDDGEDHNSKTISLTTNLARQASQ